MGQFTDLARRLSSHKKTPLVLTIISGVGLVTTGVLAARGGLKAGRILEERYGDDRSEITLKEKTKATWHAYVPAASAGAFTLISIVTMHKVTERNLLVMTASATLATNTLKRYQERVVDRIGAAKESDIRDQIAKETLATADNIPPAEELALRGDGTVMCLDEMSGRFFRSSVVAMQHAENQANKEMLSSMFLSLNDFYAILGLEPNKAGEMLGFNTNNMINLHFSPQLVDERQPVIVVSHINPPIPDYYHRYH